MGTYVEARDRADLGLTGVQQELLEAVQETGTPVVLVLVKKAEKHERLSLLLANLGEVAHLTNQPQQADQYFE